MVNIKTLLPDLKELVKELDEDLLARATGNPEIDAGLRQAFTQIEKGGRTAQAYEVWREDYLDQVAVAWVLACVFVRFMEDNHLIDECWLAGEGERRKLAEDTHELFFRKHPHDTDREYFQHVFHEVGKIPAAKDLFAEGKTPLWAVAPSGDAAMKLLAFWREMQPETGHLKRSFEVEGGDTRFLGDLYQELSERAKKKYALLQTPVFVEEFILDRTLDPAIDEFGLDTVRMIDPTCGSGHFLLGGFARLFGLWMKREDNEIVAAQKALDGVWGVDINPFAVAIARFRLIVAAVLACGIKRLKDAPGWKIHLATGDSLLFGSRWNRQWREGPGAELVRHRRGKLGSRDLCMRGQGRASGGAGPAVPRRRRESAVHHGEGPASLECGLPGSLLDLPSTILAGSPVHRAVLRPSPRLRERAMRLRRHDHGQLVHEAGVRQEADRGVLSPRST